MDFVSEVNTAGGQATMMHLPEAGFTGNSHLLMMENNNLQIARALRVAELDRAARISLPSAAKDR
jgi:hypothetical protein